MTAGGRATVAAASAVGVFLAATALSTRWPRQTEAAAASLSFIAATVLAFAAWKALQASKEQGRSLEKQGRSLAEQAEAAREQLAVLQARWAEEQGVHLDLWPRGGIAGTAQIRHSLTDVRSIQFERATLEVWNYGRHAVRLVGFEISVMPPPFAAPTHLRDAVIRAEESVRVDIQNELLNLFGLDPTGMDWQMLVLISSRPVFVRLQHRGADGRTGWSTPFRLSVTFSAHPAAKWIITGELLDALAPSGQS